MIDALGINLVGMLLLVTVLSFLPFLVMIASCFTKIVIVFLIVRNAMGVQQMPPNLVLNSAAIILSAYIMAPQVTASYNVVKENMDSFNSAAEIEMLVREAGQPFKEFLERFATERHKDFFVEAAVNIWSGSPILGEDALNNGISQNTSTGFIRKDDSANTLYTKGDAPNKNDIVILLPAFMTSELARAFEIGFLIYLPFLAIDMAVSAILMALGMQMMSPVIISTPFKLLLFVLVDGWPRLLQGLVLSYSNNI